MNEELVFGERSEDKSEADLKAEVSAEEPMEIDREESIEVRVKPVGPSHEEEQLLLEAERKIPKLTGIGRHTMSKFRLLYRADLDRSSPATIPTQHHRLIEKCRENRLVSVLIRFSKIFLALVYSILPHSFLAIRGETKAGAEETTNGRQKTNG
jgi:hypothetical protein